MTRDGSWVVAVAVACLLVTGCVAPAASPRPPTSAPLATPDDTPPPTVTLTVFAAASLREALEAVVAGYEAAAPGSTITVSFDSSAALATQIEEGAPADLFLAADTVQPDRLFEADLTFGRPVTFASTTLALVTPIDDPGQIASPDDLARPGVRIVAAGPEVPITAYAQELIANLATLPGAPSGFTAAYEANIVSREDNVRAVLAKIALGEADAGIVYATDVRAADVRSVEIPDRVNVRAVYAAALLKDAGDPEAAAAFLGWLTGPDGQAILAEAGFGPPP